MYHHRYIPHLLPWSYLTRLLAIFGSHGGVYPVPLGLHAAGSLYQCLSLESLDRYSCGVVSTDVRGHPGVFLVWSWPFLGLDSNGESLH